MLTRRTSLKLICSFISIFTLPKNAISKKSIRRYELIAKKGQHTFDNRVMSNLSLFNKVNPGPTISGIKGEILEVLFKNELDEPSSIHWHGIRNLNKMDGVPGLTQKLVYPGESFLYKFPINNAGTFWYHTHHKSWKQNAQGLHGVLIVKDNDSELNERDIILVVDDWRLDKNNQIHSKSFGSLHDWSHGGRIGNYLTINGKSIPNIQIPSEGKIRIRFVNTANARIMKLQFNNQIPFRIISIDGEYCIPFESDNITLAPGQRIDVIVENARDIQNLFEISSNDDFEVLKFKHKNNISNNIDVLNYNKVINSPPSLEENVKTFNIKMEGGAMGSLDKAFFDGKVQSFRDLAINEKKLWAFNGEIGDYNLNIADVKINDVVNLKIWNNTRWHHAMHLHGHHFWVYSKEFGKDLRLVSRDTYLMKPQEKNEIFFVAKNPGKWLFHCHMMSHNASGMVGIINIV